MEQKQAEHKSKEAEGLEQAEGWQKSERGYKGMIGRLRSEKEALEHRIADLNAPKTAPEHVFTPYLPFCAGGCGAKNIDFKPEVKCANGKCGQILGSKKDLEKLEGCPWCGGKEAKMIEEEESDDKEENEN